jgi:MSHA biogenesis protein MshE
MAGRRDQLMQGAAERKNLVAKRKLGELLVETGLLSREKLKETLEAQKGTGKRLGRLLIERGLISEEEIAFALAMQLKIPFMDLRDCDITAEVMKTIPEHICQKFFCVQHPSCLYG